jgi:uncharacterized coiled-coil protein SlyX
MPPKIWNAGKRRFKHLVQLRARIKELEKQVEGQAKTIRDCHGRFAALSVAYVDMYKEKMNAPTNT